ncbi:MAG: sigma-70 family RNA polymerase sigma factor [Planctomycetales bacterium]|nr:sigma-70 family RNA polymerase sigma factor [Planctomycetales bacterium]
MSPRLENSKSHVQAVPECAQRTDSELVSATLKGDRDSFGEIVHRYQSPLLRLALSRLGRIEVAEEVVQEAFASAFRSLASYRAEYSFRTWLWTILLNACKQKYKQLKKRPAVTELDPNQAETDDFRDDNTISPLQLAIANERTERLESLLQQLPDTQSHALRLRFFGGMKFQEIAAVMDCSLSTAKMRVRVGLEKISAVLLSSESDDLLMGDSEQ